MDLSGPARQQSIYLSGFAGTMPVVPIDYAKLEEQALRQMAPEVAAYIAGGAGGGSTMRANIQAFDQYKVLPRMLRDVSVRDMSIDLFGERLPAPLLLSPIGVAGMVHPEADIAIGKAAATLGVPYIFSNQASKPMEEVAAAMGQSPRWFQLYWSKSNELVASFVQRAERSGCKAIVVTLDTTLLGWRTQDLELAYLPFLLGKGIAQYTSDPVFQKLMNEPSPPASRSISIHAINGLLHMVGNYPGGGFITRLLSGRPIKAVQKFIQLYSNPALTWHDLAYLREITKLPVLLKGILRADDARKALDHGMNGIIVSNHGGRQVDGSISTLQALPPIVEAINGEIPVLMDSGIRHGADIFKALALGANAVCIGRPYVYGLALAGQQGVQAVIQNLMAEFDLTMGLCGCKNIAEINRDMIIGR